MIRSASLGYLTPLQDVVEPGQWTVLDAAGGPVAMEGTAVKEWRYLMSLQVHRTVTVDLSRMRDECGLALEDELRLVASWRSLSTILQGRGVVQTVQPGLNQLEMLIDGRDAGGELVLTCELTAGHSNDSTARNPLAARRAGSILWTDEASIWLEGDATRFPTEALSFSSAGIGRPDSAWMVEIDTSDLDAPALDRVRLILNTDHPIYSVLNDAENPAGKATRSFLMYDVARQLISAALSCAELVDDEEYASSSVGQVLRQRVQNYFSFEAGGLSAIRTRWRDRPGSIECDLQASFLK